MRKIRPLHFYIFFILLFIAFCFFVPDSGYDKYFWISWSKYIAENGVGEAYSNPEVNNFPLVIFLLKIFTLFVKADSIDVFNINYLKCIVIVFDFLTLYIVINLLHKGEKNILLSLVLMFNPAFWYNTVVWGQIDSIPVFFVFVALLFSVAEKPLPALVFMLFAVNTKLQTVIFLPLILIVIFNTEAPRKWSYVKIFISLAALIFFQSLIFLPFIVSGNFLQTIHALFNSSIDFYPTASRNAYNFWYLIFDDPFIVFDSISFLIPVKYWGMNLFFLFSGILFFLFLKTEKKYVSVFLVSALLVLGFFYFNTQMHERYVHAAVLFSALYAFFSGRYFLLLMVSSAYLLNLEAVMKMLNYFDDELLGFLIQHKTIVVFHPVFVSLLFLSAITGGMIDLRALSRNTRSRK